MRALSRRLDDPQGASRPFDAGRDGFVLSEGSAVLVLEELERAQGRGERIMGELLGYGLSSDAHHLTEPDPVGESPARAMRMAMDDARVTPADIQYVNAHATSTPVGDSGETRALKLALGEEHARQVPISGTKGVTGHMLGAAGAIEAGFTLLAMREGFLPPTINQTDPDPDCDLDYVPNVGRGADVECAISNSFGFGGHNAVLVMRRWPGP
jgi:3-oxoacyl-[acyl-carrier-protein] synthase II